MFEKFREEMKMLARLDKAAWDAGDFTCYLEQAEKICNRYGVPYNNIRLLVASYWPEK